MYMTVSQMLLTLTYFVSKYIRVSFFVVDFI